MKAKWTKLKYEGMTNSDEMETELENRVQFRKILDMKADAWLFDLTPEVTKLIAEAKVYIEDFSGNSLGYIEVE